MVAQGSREQERARKREQEEPHGNYIIFSNPVYKFKAVSLPLHSVYGGGHKALSSFKEKKSRFYFFIRNVSKNLLTKQTGF